MGYDIQPPFELGQTSAGGAGVADADIDADVLDQVIGKEWWFEDRDAPNALDPGGAGHRSGQAKRCRVVENASGGVLLPKRPVQLDALGEKALGYANDVSQPRVAIVDEYLPAAGVKANDKFWVTVEGLSEIAISITPAEAVISAGDPVVVAAAATSGAATAGYIRSWDPTTAATGVTMAWEINNQLGIAVSAATTADTGDGLLVSMGPRKW